MKQEKDFLQILKKAALLLPIVLAGCSDELSYFNPERPNDGLPLELRASIDQVSDTRADESGFADGDRFGLFVVNYANGEPGSLKLSDNQVNNVALTYNAEANTWQAATDIYWRDPVTPADVYGYYPFYNGLSDVESYSFEVKADQSQSASEGEMGSYEASDLLWAKTAKATPGKKVDLTFSHIMAGVKVVLQQGSGFEGDSWSNLSKTVTVDNTIRNAEVDLSSGTVTATGSVDRNIVMNPEVDAWRAVVVPQTVSAGKTIIGITIDGKSYAYTRPDAMKYTAGKLHTFTIKIDRKGDNGDYVLTLINEDITPWEADKSSHDFESNAYLTVNVPEAGTLKKCLEDMHLNAGTIKNLKITGYLTNEDFEFIREELTSLSAINLKYTKILNASVYRTNDIDGSIDFFEMDDALPTRAFAEVVSLRRIILPEGVKFLGPECLAGLTLSSTIIIPESVTEIGTSAFWGTMGVFTIVLPSKVERIESAAFYATQAYMELKLPNTLKYIGAHAFMNARGVTGRFTLPNKLEYIGFQAFCDFGNNLDGEIIIPEKINKIQESAFAGIRFARPVTLALHDGISEIGNGAFEALKFSSPITFPKSLIQIGDRSFYGCMFSGDIKLPENISYVGKSAFEATNIKGTFEIPSSLEVVNDFLNWTMIDKLVLDDKVEIINDYACQNCSELRYLQLGKNLSEIGAEAFAGCTGLQTIVCMAKTPPTIANSAFRYFDPNNCVVEVPEESVEVYRRTEGWSKFPSITPHHELSLSVSEFSCLNKEFYRDLIVRAEGPWEIVECPEWIHTFPDHADYKEEIQVKVDALPVGEGDRHGKVIFRLKDSGYTNYLTIHQLDYPELEDREIILQKASGNGSGIPIFIVGEGYGAESIVNGDFLNRANEMVEHLFSIEPYKTYRNLFSISTAISLSSDDGAGDIVTSKKSKFGLTFPSIDEWQIDYLKSYVKDVSSIINESNINNALIVILSNYDAFAGSSYRDPHGDFVAACVGISNGIYPFDDRGLIHFYVGGEAFGGLANEQINHFEFIKGCTCPGCNDQFKYLEMKGKGLFENVTISGKSEDAPWRDFIYHPQYSALVDMYEGGYNHQRGVWRSEIESVMSTYIPYYNTISRYAIYKQIMKRAGLNPSLDEFILNDKIEIPN